MRGKVSDIARTVFITIIIIIIIIIVINIIIIFIFSIGCAQCPCYNYAWATSYLVSNCCLRRHSICGIKQYTRSAIVEKYYQAAFTHCKTRDTSYNFRQFRLEILQSHP